MTRRESRVINAFINCVRRREYTLDYAITLIEDNQRYGWLSEDAKEYFYDSFPEPAEVDPDPQPEGEAEGVFVEGATETEE
jgi:hypothetical protein